MSDEFDHYTDDLSMVSLHYVRAETSEPVILVHGWLGFWWE